MGAQPSANHDAASFAHSSHYWTSGPSWNRNTQGQLQTGTLCSSVMEMRWLLAPVAAAGGGVTRLIAVLATLLDRKWDQLSSVGGSILDTVCSWTVVAAMRWWWDDAALGETSIVQAALLMETSAVKLISFQSFNSLSLHQWKKLEKKDFNKN